MSPTLYFTIFFPEIQVFSRLSAKKKSNGVALCAHLTNAVFFVIMYIVYLYLQEGAPRETVFSELT